MYSGILWSDLPLVKDRPGIVELWEKIRMVCRLLMNSDYLDFENMAKQNSVYRSKEVIDKSGIPTFRHLIKII